MRTYCADCKHVFKERKSDPPWRWMCVKHKRMDGFGFVTKDCWDDMPPFLYAKDVNGGDCPLFEREDGKQMRLTDD